MSGQRVSAPQPCRCTHEIPVQQQRARASYCISWVQMILAWLETEWCCSVPQLMRYDSD